jgi:hypothetical protein
MARRHARRPGAPAGRAAGSDVQPSPRPAQAGRRAGGSLPGERLPPGSGLAGGAPRRPGGRSGPRPGRSIRQPGVEPPARRGRALPRRGPAGDPGLRRTARPRGGRRLGAPGAAPRSVRLLSRRHPRRGRGHGRRRRGLRRRAVLGDGPGRPRRPRRLPRGLGARRLRPPPADPSLAAPPGGAPACRGPAALPAPPLRPAARRRRPLPRALPGRRLREFRAPRPGAAPSSSATSQDI